ncbi:MAG: YiiX/YebB-like N1pC/P60 family cysteine hydrolase [Candidatus Delongbacteria bacterium]|jgi:uncharacterized protein YycO|nr:YiiX/YebB-like N1pC/P60 family cysteine hydrolase [Candidatus Delongbacteria bacterium]
MKLIYILTITLLFFSCSTEKLVIKPDADIRKIQNVEISKNIRENLDNGDWLVIRGYHVADYLVAGATFADLSHVAIYDEYNDQIIEAEGIGIHSTTFDDFMDKSHRIVIIRPKWATSESAKKAVEKARGYIGKKYDFLGTIGINDKERLYCSELVVYVYQPWFEKDEEIPHIIEPSKMHKLGKVIFDTGKRKSK